MRLTTDDYRLEMTIETAVHEAESEEFTASYVIDAVAETYREIYPSEVLKELTKMVSEGALTVRYRNNGEALYRKEAF